MLSPPQSGRKGPTENRLTSLHEQKSAARAIVAGERNARAARPHRSSLPDVDMAAVRLRPRPSLALRLAAVIRHVVRVAAGQQAAAILLSVIVGVPADKRAKTAYIGPEDIVS